MTVRDQPIFNHDGRESMTTRERRHALVARLRQCQQQLGARSLGVAVDANSASIVARIADNIEGCTTRPCGAWLFPDGKDDSLARGVCRHRLCPHCHSIRSARLGAAMTNLVSKQLEGGAVLAVLTLTIKHNKFDRLKWLRELVSLAWSRLTKRSLWKALVSQYHRVAEIERTRANGWHPHFHVLVKLTFNKREAQQAWRDGRLQDVKLFRWWARRFYGNGWKRAVLVAGAVATPVAAKFLSTRSADLEQWLRDEWEAVTAKLERPSPNIRLEMVKRGRKAGTVLHPVTKEPRSVEKFVAELVKYTTKGSARSGKLGLMQYSPWELVEYVQGVKSWRLHQSSRAWSAITNEFEREDLETQQQQRELEGGRFVKFTQLVANVEQACAGKADELNHEAAIRDGLAVMRLWRVESEKDKNFNRWNLRALEGALGCLLGDRESIRPAWRLTVPERVEVARLHGSEWRPDMWARYICHREGDMRSGELDEILVEYQADQEAQAQQALRRLEDLGGDVIDDSGEAVEYELVMAGDLT